MLYVGIDVAKNKHDCCIIDSDGVVLMDSFQISNSLVGFNFLYSSITSFLPNKSISDVRVGLEATGHYSCNIETFLLSKGLNLTIFNPLSVNLYRKGQTLRKTKTDKTDARFLAAMLFSSSVAPYTPIPNNIKELKALTRHRSRLIGYRTKLKVSVSRLLTIIFPELSEEVWSIHQHSCYELLLAFPNPKAISECHLTKLTNILSLTSRGKYGRDKALKLRELASNSIGSNSISIAFELQQTIRIINNIQTEIDILDKHIKNVMLELNSPIISIPGISFTLGAIILAEIGDIFKFDTPAKLLAFAGLEPSAYQSGNFNAKSTPMVKRGSTYLRWAVLNASRLVPMRDKTFEEYYHKKKAEGKHHNVAISHVGKKLIRIIFHLLKTNSKFVAQAI